MSPRSWGRTGGDSHVSFSTARRPARGRGGTTDSLYKVLQTQLNGEGSLADTTIAEYHDLVWCCEPSGHVEGIKDEVGRKGVGPGTAVRGAESERLGSLDRDEEGGLAQRREKDVRVARGRIGGGGGGGEWNRDVHRAPRQSLVT